MYCIHAAAALHTASLLMRRGNIGISWIEQQYVCMYSTARELRIGRKRTRCPKKNYIAHVYKSTIHPL